MSLSKDQARRTAQILYPQLWVSNPEEAIAKTIEFVHQAAFDPEPGNASPHALNNVAADSKTSAIIDSLRAHMKRAHMHVNVTARAIGVSAYTVRTWLEGKYQPNDANAKKISEFLEQLQATPELLKPES
jgi:DNA-binding transcriptional regulator YiaG